MNKLIQTTTEGMARDIANRNKKMIVLCDEDGNCNGCKDCCTLVTPITKEEYKFLKKKISKKHIRQYLKNQLSIQKKGMEGIDISCFFHIDGKCTIYNTRPLVCKKFHCREDLNEMVYEFKLRREPIFFLFELLPEEWQGPYKNVLTETKRIAQNK